jgi:lipopolysaccharide biosynthesis glycosyltransferase
MSDIIPVVFVTDDTYAPYCGVAVYSLIANTSPERKYEIWIMYKELDEKYIYKLEKLSKANISVRCLCIKEFLVDITFYESIHLTEAAFYRVMIPHIFKQDEKII